MSLIPLFTLHNSGTPQVIAGGAAGESYAPFPNLVGIVFSGLSLNGCQLMSNQMAGATLTGVQFTGCTLSGVNFSGATMSSVSFTNCTIKDCKFVAISMNQINFHHCQMDGNKFINATGKGIDWNGTKSLNCDFQNSSLMA